MLKILLIISIFIITNLFAETLTLDDGRVIELNEDGTYKEIIQDFENLDEISKIKLQALEELLNEGIITEKDFIRKRKEIFNESDYNVNKEDQSHTKITNNDLVENPININTIKLILKLLNYNYENISLLNETSFLINGLNYEVSDSGENFKIFIDEFEVQNLNNKYMQNINLDDLSTYKGHFFDKILIKKMSVTNIYSDEIVFSFNEMIIDRFDFKEIALLFKLIDSQINPLMTQSDHLIDLENISINDLTKLNSNQISEAFTDNEYSGYARYDNDFFKFNENYYSNGDYFYKDENINDASKIISAQGKWKVGNNQLCYKYDEDSEFYCMDVYQKVERGKKYYYHGEDNIIYSKIVPEININKENLFNVKNILNLINSIDINKISIKEWSFSNLFTMSKEKYYYDYFELSNIKNSNISSFLIKNFIGEDDRVVHTIKKFEINDFSIKNPDLIKIDWEKESYLNNPTELLYLFQSLRKISCEKCYTKQKKSNLSSGSDLIEISNINIENIGNYPFPTSLNIIFKGVTAEYSDEIGSFEIIKKLNYDSLKFDTNIKYNWNTRKKTLNFFIDLGIEDAASINFEGQINNLDKEMISTDIENFDFRTYFMMEPRLEFVDLIIRDDSLTDRLIRYGAFDSSTTEKQFRNNIINELQSNPMIVQEGITSKLIMTVISFIENPNRIIVQIKPDKPVSLTDLMATNDPDEVAELLNLKIRN